MRKTLGNESDVFTIVYLDDILIASNTFSTRVSYQSSPGKTRKAGFRLNREKCEFFESQIKFLGHTFDEITAEMNEETKKAIENFAKPQNKKAIQAFLGLVNWDRIRAKSSDTNQTARTECKIRVDKRGKRRV